jgi:osmotically-inducible protein OsmY
MIAYPPRAAAQVQSQLATNLQKLAGNAGLPPIEVTVQARTVVLRGAVGTAHNRDLAARLALLEPGVDQVQNELTIAQPRVPAETPTRPTD